jgi:hypothetical protein
MKVNSFFLACAIFAVIAIVMFAFISVQQEFPIFNPSGQNSSFVNISGDVGAEDSRFMWNNDGLALIAQAFVLFAAAAATLGLLKAGGEK